MDDWELAFEHFSFKTFEYLLTHSHMQLGLFQCLIYACNNFMVYFVKVYV